MTSKKKTILLASLGGLLLVCVGLGLVMSQFGSFSINLPVKHKAGFEPGDLSFLPAELQVDGNRIVDGRGLPVILKGVMAPDPAVLRSRNKFNQELFANIRELRANVIRIPVHPERWARDPDYLWRYLDPAVAWAGQNGLYAIIDWHFIGNVATGAGSQMPDLDQPAREITLQFWQATAIYFKSSPNVIFEIFNEPQGISGADWADSAREIVRAIRDEGAGQLIIVGGIDYGKDLSWFVKNPLEDDNLAYAAHIYPAHSSFKWDTWFGRMSEDHPVVITEWGYMDSSAEPDTAYLVGSRESYGSPFLAYLDGKDIGWVACWYDDEWLPSMLTRGWKGLNPYGEFVAQAMKAE